MHSFDVGEISHQNGGRKEKLNFPCTAEKNHQIYHRRIYMIASDYIHISIESFPKIQPFIEPQGHNSKSESSAALQYKCIQIIQILIFKSKIPNECVKEDY